MTGRVQGQQVQNIDRDYLDLFYTKGARLSIKARRIHSGSAPVRAWYTLTAVSLRTVVTVHRSRS
jgi:hypothetical protein